MNEDKIFKFIMVRFEERIKETKEYTEAMCGENIFKSYIENRGKYSTEKCKLLGNLCLNLIQHELIVKTKEISRSKIITCMTVIQLTHIIKDNSMMSIKDDYTHIYLSRNIKMNEIIYLNNGKPVFKKYIHVKEKIFSSIENSINVFLNVDLNNIKGPIFDNSLSEVIGRLENTLDLINNSIINHGQDTGIMDISLIAFKNSYNKIGEYIETTNVKEILYKYISQEILCKNNEEMISKQYINKHIKDNTKMILTILKIININIKSPYDKNNAQINDSIGQYIKNIEK